MPNSPEIPLVKMSNRGHFSDSERFISTCNDLQEHGRHPKSLQDSLRNRYCVPRCVPPSCGEIRKLPDGLRGLATLLMSFISKLHWLACCWRADTPLVKCA